MLSNPVSNWFRSIDVNAMCRSIHFVASFSTKLVALSSFVSLPAFGDLPSAVAALK